MSEQRMFDELLKILDEHKTSVRIPIPICHEHYEPFTSLLNNIEHDNDDLVIDNITKKYVLPKSKFIKNGFMVKAIESDKKFTVCKFCNNTKCDYVIVLNRLSSANAEIQP